MINLIGFDGPAPHCVIYWKLNGEEISKTVCYSAEGETAALDRFQTVGDFYNGYDNFVVEYGQNDERMWA